MSKDNIVKISIVLLVASGWASIVLIFLNFGSIFSSVENSLFFCEARISQIIKRQDRQDMPMPDIGKYFVRGASTSSIYPVSKDEEIFLLDYIKTKFGIVPPNFRFSLAQYRDGLSISIKDYDNNITMDGIEFNKCGHLVGDDLLTRMKKNEPVR